METETKFNALFCPYRFHNLLDTKSVLFMHRLWLVQLGPLDLLFFICGNGPPLLFYLMMMVMIMLTMIMMIMTMIMIAIMITMMMMIYSHGDIFYLTIDR